MNNPFLNELAVMQAAVERQQARSDMFELLVSLDFPIQFAVNFAQCLDNNSLDEIKDELNASELDKASRILRRFMEHF